MYKMHGKTHKKSSKYIFKSTTWKEILAAKESAMETAAGCANIILEKTVLHNIQVTGFGFLIRPSPDLPESSTCSSHVGFISVVCARIDVHVV
jgi:hypothetical protein